MPIEGTARIVEAQILVENEGFSSQVAISAEAGERERMLLWMIHNVGSLVRLFATDRSTTALSFDDNS